MANGNCINKAEMLLSGLMFYLGFLRPLSSVTQALVLHTLRNTRTQRMFRQSACGKFAFFFCVLFVINPTKPNGIDFTEGGKSLVAIQVMQPNKVSEPEGAFTSYQATSSPKTKHHNLNKMPLFALQPR